MKSGFYLENDSTYFETILQDAQQQMDSVTLEQRTTFQGLPVQYYEYAYQNNLRYKVMQFHRGGRIVLLLVGGMPEYVNEAADELFHSVELLPYPHQERKQIQVDGFAVETTASPLHQSPKEQLDDDEATNLNRRYLGVTTLTDSIRAVSYVILRYKMPSYFWTASDTAYLSIKANNSLEDGDSMVQRKFTLIGKQPALLTDVVTKGSQNIERTLLFFHGDSLVHVSANIPQEQINDTCHQRFFETIRVQSDLPATLTKSKSDLFLKALHAKDSVAYAEVKRTLDQMVFTESELPFLHEAVLFPAATEEELAIRSRLVNSVDQLNSPATIDFVRAQYSQLKEDHARPELLYLLAHHLSDTSYQLLAELLERSVPAGYDYDKIADAMKDSLELTVRFLPRFLPLLADSVMAPVIADVVVSCLEDSLVGVSSIRPHRKAILAGGKRSVQAIKKNAENYWSNLQWMKLLAFLNDSESIAVLRQILQVQEPWAQMDAALRLAELRQVVPPGVWEKLARNVEVRYNLYYRMKEGGLIKLFPAAYATRQALAESELHASASEDTDVKSVTFLGSRMAMYKGKSTSFLLYKIVIATEEGTGSYLGVAGPFEGTSPLSGNATGVYWEENYQPAGVNGLLKAYLKQLGE